MDTPQLMHICIFGVCGGPAIYDTIRDITHAQYRFGHVMICNEHFKPFFNRFVIVNGFKNSKNNDFRLFTVRDMHNTVWDMNDPNCIVLGPTAPLEYLVLQRVLVSYTESVSCILLDVNLNTEIAL